MKMNKYIISGIFALILSFSFSGCDKYLDEPAENRTFTGTTDYTKSENMILPLIGIYAELNGSEWEVFPLISVRGDDVNAGGLGDQQPFSDTDNFGYDKDYWMYNSVWQNYFQNVFAANSALDEIAKFQEFASNKALGDQYIAEVKVMKSWWLFHLSRLWGALPVPPTANPSDLFGVELSSKDEIMGMISTWMDEAIPLLPAVHPKERNDVPGGVTKYTALALKALANLELKEYQKVADATGEIINSGKFQLQADYYNLFKIPGKLDNENIWELQFSDLGQGTGTNYAYLYAFFGPQGWTPKVAGAGDGWGFWEPSLKYIKFMLDRNETLRLETSVIFTDRGIEAVKEYTGTSNLPSWISNTTRSGDVFNDYARAMFASGKHYLPSDQLTPGRTDYGTNKNFICIRYSEILLMYAEALVQGATGNAGTADAAVNLVRNRAGLNNLSGVTLDQVMDEKYAELAMEWGSRFYDMVRLGRYNELSYDGRTFDQSKIFLPYPQNQIDQLPVLDQK